MCLQRSDFANLKKRADNLVAHYDNSLIIAYIEELDDPDLIRMIVERLKYASLLITPKYLI